MLTGGYYLHKWVSPPTRGAWIEIAATAQLTPLNNVAPHTGGVD